MKVLLNIASCISHINPFANRTPARLLNKHVDNRSLPEFTASLRAFELNRGSAPSSPTVKILEAGAEDHQNKQICIRNGVKLLLISYIASLIGWVPPHVQKLFANSSAIAAGVCMSVCERDRLAKLQSITNYLKLNNLVDLAKTCHSENLPEYQLFVAALKELGERQVVNYLTEHHIKVIAESNPAQKKAQVEQSAQKIAKQEWRTIEDLYKKAVDQVFSPK